MAATLKTFGLNSGLIKQFPLEKLVLEPGQLATSAHTKVPMALLKPYIAGRNAVTDLLPKGFITIPKAQSIMQNNIRELKKFDRTITIDNAWLQNGCEQSVVENCESAFLEALPDETREVKPKEAQIECATRGSFLGDGWQKNIPNGFPKLNVQNWIPECWSGIGAPKLIPELVSRIGAPLNFPN